VSVASMLNRAGSSDAVIGGNAARCVAISARHEGASAIVLESAPKFYWGSNIRHTR
jgi:hypothetical protein